MRSPTAVGHDDPRPKEPTVAAIDRLIEHIAREQHGVFNIRQARAVGATDAMIRSRLANGTWIREVRGVYRLAAFPRTWLQRLSAAALSKENAHIGVKAAAALHGLDGFSPCRPELIVAPGSNHESKIARVHEFAESEATVVTGIRATTIRQTLIDVAGVVPREKLRRAAELAAIEGLVTVEDLGARFLEIEHLRPHGVGDLRAVLDEIGDAGYVPPQSELERILYGMLARLGIDFVRQAELSWRSPLPMIVDAFVPSWPLIIEADGRRWHTRVADRERDHDRDNVAAAHGVPVMRFTHRMLTRSVPRCESVLDQCRARAELAA
jgi:very-short-patch-repair endonuclease